MVSVVSGPVASPVTGDELCHGYHVWILRGRVDECSRCGWINDEEKNGEG